MQGQVVVEELVSWFLAQNGAPIMYSSASPELVKVVQAEFGVNALADKLDRLFGELSVALVDAGIERLIVAGGETSGAVVEALALNVLSIGRKLTLVFRQYGQGRKHTGFKIRKFWCRRLFPEGGISSGRRNSMTEMQLREQICLLAKSMFDRGLTVGSSGNISVRCDDGRLLVTPTESCLGRLDPSRISLLDPNGVLLSGERLTKEMPLHRAFYESRSQAGAIVHLHSSHAVALSTLPVEDRTNFLPPLTPYSIMRLGKVALVPYFRPGDIAVAKAIKDLAGRHSAVMLSNHGPIVAGKSLEAAVFAIEELEETSKLALMLRGMHARGLDEVQVQDIMMHFDVSEVRPRGCDGLREF